ncbi:chorismate mutase [Mycolicibacterium aubagnense]|uniref:Chorismate mutase n=1 Tax=Mycolicibacterium aubagnense TaxID=319707 RepID=A0ABM7IHS2_9MYCO|nr:chorismate mutase [Mycolicibacterium aubagnense]TLH68519.1 chorismate mutase AroQ, gamma subclass [Mycolicibacterium aubagnense]WGI32195.1 chorismate mutase [Mycolicibacterium aubagnense]BBX86263.1 secreted chorismate mutase [Mycolicibacterium aubagnense]
MKLAALLVAVLGMTSVPLAHADDNPLFRLVDTAAQRLQTADPVAAVKWISGGSIEDPARVDQVLAAVGSQAQSAGADPVFVRKVFTDQIHATEGIEYLRFSQWKFDPGAAPATAPDLSESRTAIDGFNRTMVTEIAAQQGTLQSPGCAAALGTARAQVTASRHLDPLYQEALTAATRGYCS